MICPTHSIIYGIQSFLVAIKRLLVILLTCPIRGIYSNKIMKTIMSSECMKRSVCGVDNERLTIQVFLNMSVIIFINYTLVSNNHFIK